MIAVKNYFHLDNIHAWLVKAVICLLCAGVVMVGIRVFCLYQIKPKKRPHDIKKIVAQKLSKQKKRR